MNPVYQTFTTLDGIDIDDLILSSIPYMDAGTYEWPEQCVDTASKLAFIRGYIDQLMGFSGSYNYHMSLDGRVVSIMFCFRIGSTLRTLLSFIRPDKDGSRSFVYNPEAFPPWKAFLASEGFTDMEGLMVQNSPMHKAIVKEGVTEFEDKVIGSGVVSTFTYKVE